jgi:hypothetical protein
MAGIDDIFDTTLAEEVIENARGEERKRTSAVRDKAKSYAVSDPDVMAEIDEILYAEDTISAQLKYQELGQEIRTEGTSRYRKGVAREARKVLGSVFGHNLLRGQEFSRRAADSAKMRALQSKTLTQDERDRKKTFRQRNVLTPFSGTSKIVYRPRGRDIVLTQYEPETGEHGLEAALIADRQVALSILDRKEELERDIAKYRKDSKKSEYVGQLEDLKAYASEFIKSRRKLWEHAKIFGAKAGLEAEVYASGTSDPQSKIAVGRAAQVGDTYVSSDGTKILTIRRRMGDEELSIRFDVGSDDRLKDAQGRDVATDAKLRELGFIRIPKQ